MNITIPQYVHAVLNQLESAGYRAYLAGGCVRDLMMGKAPHDYDVATDATPDEIENVFGKNRTLDVGKKYGTIILITQHDNVEITTFRADGTYSDGRKPDAVFFSDSIEEDVSRRDFTINAMAYHPIRGIVDLFEGSNDLQAKRIRTVGIPHERFGEDYLRMLRCIRFATVLQFEIEEETFRAVQSGAVNIRQISSERVREELVKIMLAERVDLGLSLLCDSGLATYVFPSLAVFRRECPKRFEILQSVLRQTALNLLLRFSVLFYFLKSSEDLYRIRPTNEEVEIVEGVIKFKLPSEISRIQVKKVMNAIKPSVLEYALRTLSACGDRAEEAERFMTEKKSVEDSEEPYRISELMLNGDDLLRMGIEKGPQVGKILHRLNEWVIENPTGNTKEKLTEQVKMLR